MIKKQTNKKYKNTGRVKRRSENERRKTCTINTHDGDEGSGNTRGTQLGGVNRDRRKQNKTH